MKKPKFFPKNNPFIERDKLYTIRPRYVATKSSILMFEFIKIPVDDTVNAVCSSVFLNLRINNDAKNQNNVSSFSTNS